MVTPILPDDPFPAVEQAVGETVGEAVDELFVELMCADEELLAAEFEAIVAAGWPEQPRVPPPRRGEPTEPGKDPDGRVVSEAVRVASRSWRMPSRQPERERSPPLGRGPARTGHLS